jgi:hypothetical protein
MEIREKSLFQVSVPAFQVYSNADLRSTKVRWMAAVVPVASEVYVWEPSYSNIMFVSNLMITMEQVVTGSTVFELPHE